MQVYVGLLFVVVQSLSHVSFAAPRTVAYQSPPSMGFPRQEYGSGLPFPSLGDLPDLGITSGSPALAGGFFTTEPPGKQVYLGRRAYRNPATVRIQSTQQCALSALPGETPVC